MSVQALQEYTRVAKYAKHNPELARRELWNEQITRVFEMHREHLGEEKYEKLKDDLAFAEKMTRKKYVLGSQRALQFGGKAILDKNARIFNCIASYCDRPRFFQETMYLLLCGCGCGFSVQKHHVEKLPNIKMPSDEKAYFEIPDSIEGWSDAIGVIMSSFFDSDQTDFPEYRGKTVVFDFSRIRPEGSPLSSGGKAPGPNGLKAAMEKIDYVMRRSCKMGNKIRTIDAYDVVMHSSDAVLSGGIRRSATLCMFSFDDEDMINAKTGSWFIDNPQRGRSNNSALLLRDKVSKEEFKKLIKNVKQFGEPGFIWSDNEETLFNPCVEISLYGHIDKEHAKSFAVNEREIEEIENDAVKQGTSLLSGWQACNLCELNMKKCNNPEIFFQACKAAAILGTIQASYTNFEYLGGTSNAIIRREALLGVSMTGMADNPDVAFSPKVQRKGAQIVLDVNKKVAEIIGIMPCARGTCVKPAGSTSCILGTASGIHPHHSNRYFRRVQANKLETPLQFFQMHNPKAVEPSVWSANGTDMVVTFLCEVPVGAKTKNQVGALELLENVKLTQQNWVEAGTRYDYNSMSWLRHNVSNTINIKPDEWEDVTNQIYRNRKYYAGISMLPMSGDKDYPQAPFCGVLNEMEIVRKYGKGSMMASGLIVDGLREFDNNLWAACDCVLDIGEILSVERLHDKIKEDCEYNGVQWRSLGLAFESQELSIEEEERLVEYLNSTVKNLEGKRNWVRRVVQFADRYLDGDVKETTYLMKDVHNWKLWCDLEREYVEIDWSSCKEEEYGSLENFGTESACAGGACELGDIGMAINDRERQKDNYI